MDELRLGGEPLEAVVLPQAGARLHRLRAFGHDLLRTPADPTEHLRDPFYWGGYVMAPWCNRISTRPTTVGGRTARPVANFPDGSAIHGLVYASPWRVSGDRRTLRISSDGDGWPWGFEVELAVSVADTRLQLACRLWNRADEPMPAGIGFHPWWRRPVELAVDAGRVYSSNLAAAAAPEPVSGTFDLREPGLPADGLDATWTGLGSAPIQLAWPALGVRAALRLSAGADHVVVASPAAVDAVAVEVQSHAPNGLERLLAGQPGGMALLRPGEELEIGVELEVARD